MLYAENVFSTYAISMSSPEWQDSKLPPYAAFIMQGKTLSFRMANFIACSFLMTEL